MAPEDGAESDPPAVQADAPPAAPAGAGMAPEDPSRRNDYPDYTVTCPSRYLGLSLTTDLVVVGAHSFYRGQVHPRDIVVAFGEFNVEGLDGSEAQFNCIQQLVADLPRPLTITLRPKWRQNDVTFCRPGPLGIALQVTPGGVRVGRVNPGSENSDQIEAGDFLVGVNGQPLISMEHLSQANTARPMQLFVFLT